MEQLARALSVIQRAVERDTPGLVAGLFAGWTSLFFALIWALLSLSMFLVLGLIRVIFGLGPSLVDTAIHGLKFSLGEIVIAFIGAFRLPLWLLAGAAFAILLETAILVFEDRWLHFQDCRTLSDRERDKLEPLLSDVARDMDIPESQLPTLMATRNWIVGAWASGRHIVLHDGIGLYRGAPAILTDEELRAVLAHELNHIRQADAVAASLLQWVSLPVYLPLLIGAKLLGKTAKEGAGTPRGVIAMVVGAFLYWPAWIIISLIILPLQARAGRQHEYEADAAATRAGYGGALQRVLEREAMPLEPARNGWEKVLYATHPPVEHRVQEILRQLAAAPAPSAPAVRPAPSTPLPAPQPRRRPRLPYPVEVVDVVLGLVLVAALIIGIPLIFKHHSSPPVIPGNAPTVYGPSHAQNGTEVGYQDNQLGAVAAAANYGQDVFGPALIDPSQERTILTTIVAPADQAAQIAAVTDEQNIVLRHLNGRSASVRTVSVAYHVDSYSNQAASIDVASQQFIAAAGQQLQPTCAIGHFELQWLGDWKVTDLTSKAVDSQSQDPATCQPATDYTSLVR